MLDRTPKRMNTDAQRAALREYQRARRRRKQKGQSVFRITAFDDHALDLLIARGILRDGIEYGHAAIEAALTRFVNEEPVVLK